MTTVNPIQSQIQLRVTGGAHRDEIFRLERSIVSIGRSTPENSTHPGYLTVPEPTVSRLHAVLTWEPGAKAYMIHHRSQTNSTMVNNEILSVPKLLALGDQISLGRLCLTVEEMGDQSPPVKAGAAPNVEKGTELVLFAQKAQGDRILESPVGSGSVVLTFSKAAKAEVNSSRTDDGAQHVEVAGASENSQLVFSDIQSAGHCHLELNSQNSVESDRISRGEGLELHYRLPEGNKVQFLAGDTLFHQGYYIWFDLRESQSRDGRTGLFGPPKGQTNAKRINVLSFLSGPWIGSKIRLLGDNPTPVQIGPGEAVLKHRFPPNPTPTCRLTIQGEECRLRAEKVRDDEFIEVDGDLIFSGESRRLVSGSRISVGDSEMLWCEPNQHAVYTNFVVVSSEQEHPIKKARVLLGTAAHCEIRFQEKTLSPVIGRLEYQDDKLRYHHQNIVSPARVDGMETSAGLYATLNNGSKIKLTPDFEVTIIMNSPA